MSTKKKLLLIFGGYALLLIAIFLIFGSDGKNEEFQPQNEFKLDNWVEITVAGIDMSINKAVLYIVMASVITCTSMIWIAKRMQAKPNKVQMAVEVIYDVIRKQITGDNLSDKLAAKYFPFLATLFVFILFSNFIGLIPLPTNPEHPLHIFGLEVPSFALYAATANISIPLVLTLVVWILYQRLSEPPILLLNISNLFETFGAFLAVLIAIEIFVNIRLYLGADVLPVQLVIATALMAICRKIIVLDFDKVSADYILASGATLLALGITYWLIAKKS